VVVVQVPPALDSSHARLGLSTASRQLTPLSSPALTGKHTSGIYVSHARVCVLLRGEDLADAAERVAGAVVPRRRGAGAGPPWCTRSAGSRGRRRPRRRPGHALRCHGRCRGTRSRPFAVAVARHALLVCAWPPMDGAFLGLAPTHIPCATLMNANFICSVTHGRPRDRTNEANTRLSSAHTLVLYGSISVTSCRQIPSSRGSSLVCS